MAKSVFEQLREIRAALPDEPYADPPNSPFTFHVNVKMNGPQYRGGLKQIIHLFPEEIRPVIEAEMTRDKEQEIWNQWAERGREQVLMLIKGQTHSGGQGYYNKKLGPLIAADKPTGYADIDAAPIAEEKRKLVANLDREDAQIASHVAVLDASDAGFYGRSSGHFCFRTKSDLCESLLEEVEQRALNTPLGDQDAFAELAKEVSGLYAEHKAAQWLCKTVKQQHRNMNFNEELRWSLQSEYEERPEWPRNAAVLPLPAAAGGVETDVTGSMQHAR